MMRKSIFILLLAVLWGGLSIAAFPLPIHDNIPVTVGMNSENGTDNYFMNGAIFLIGLILLWFLFFKFLYPILLKHYNPAYCKNLFWSLLMLYGLAWVAIGSYVLFDIGFRLHVMKWVFVFIGVTWLIWFIIILLKKEKTVY